MSKRPLTTRQQKFVALYDGNGTDAARKAGYAGDDTTLANVARNLLRKTEIAQAIKDRTAKSPEGKALKRKIASREERQAFWTKVMDADEEEMNARLKASELLAKSQADFIQKHELSGPDGKPIAVNHSNLTDEQLEAAIQAKLKGGA